MFQIELIGDDTLSIELAALPGRVDRALLRAINRSINSGRTAMTRSIKDDTGLKSGDVSKALILTQATGSRLQARLAASLKRIPLIQFNAKGPMPSRGRGRGVRAKLPSGANVYPHAFIATLRSGHTGVFQRKGTKRLPIQERYGPSLGHVFMKFKQPTIDKILEVFQTNFDHEMGFKDRGGDAGTN